MAFGKSHRDPYATSVGHLIEKATFAGVQTEDWGQFMHICDIINTAHDGPKDAVKALKKRISKNYNHKEIQLTLSLIDMCMQNCGPSFQSLIVKKEFIKDSLVKLLNPRYTLPLDIQNRILNFIKTWSQGFPGGVDVSEVKEVYLDLLKKGVQFPPSDAEAETARQEKLYKTGREMQERIMDLLIVVENEDVTIELIQVNEDLNNALLGCERFTRNQQRILEQNRNQREDASTTSEPSAPSCDLLDLRLSPPMPRATLGELNTVNAQLSDLNFSSPSPVVTNNLNPSLRPQVDLLALENTETPLFPQRTSQNVTSSPTYESFPEYSNSVLQPVSLQSIPATPSSQRLPSLPSNHPAMPKNDLQPPNYYEVMEFDPLAPAVATEAVYEEIDVHHQKGAQSHSDC
ncbi:TOM1-like protein 1 isoform X3 [Ursus maritimus]|uniref:TOM1-like protein 1 isoform X3 n=1 Tax=Ursus maritimus TaxID=29073 RepID=A0A384DQQ1_URSMA|nr:TOM1-like protein 1 isoform X3 [Ursus maritimus]